MIRYFAYGSCLNLSSFRNTMKEADCEERFKVLCTGKLNGFKLAFTRKKKDGSGALDIVDSEGDYVLGIVYEIPDEAIEALDKREGCPNCYYRIRTDVVVEGTPIDVITYVVKEKVINEVKPSDDYYYRVLDGMLKTLPADYINKYLVEHYNRKFTNIELKEDALYHYNSEVNTSFMKENIEFYEIVKIISMYLGNTNDIVERIQPTSEMFRILAKCTELAARGELDFGHMMPKVLVNKLCIEFENIANYKLKRYFPL